MSKYVKNLVAEHLRDRLRNIHNALLVNMVGLDANTNTRLRAILREKKIQVVVVKNSMAARATEGTPLAPLFAGLGGTAAVCWGGEDIVSLSKEITKLVQRRQVQAVRGPRRRDGRRTPHRRRRRSGSASGPAAASN